jgi:CubicO group peptidase (beta-lactamase class C family)
VTQTLRFQAANRVACFVALLSICVLPQSFLWSQTGNPWLKVTPESVGMDTAPMDALDHDFKAGKYPNVDSMLVIRCSKDVYERHYPHDYGRIFYKEAHTKGPLNARLTGIYNYFDPQYHPYYQGTEAHTMQSVTKTVTSVTIGIAMYRGDFHASPDTPIINFFDVSKVKNLDDRKRHITLKDLLTMRSGLDWDEDLPYNDPHNGSSAMEATDDWVQFVIDRPMTHEPGTFFAYSSGVAELLSYVFQKATGQDIEAYATEHLFKPLGFEHQYWKRTPLGVVDTEGGLYLRSEDLAKIGYLYLHDGMWNGQRILSTDWVKQSITPSTEARRGLKYGFLWWLVPHGESGSLAWAALGLGGQRLLVVPEDQLLLVFTAWDILETKPLNARDLIDRITSGTHPYTCGP